MSHDVFNDFKVQTRGQKRGEGRKRYIHARPLRKPGKHGNRPQNEMVNINKERKRDCYVYMYVSKMHIYKRIQYLEIVKKVKT